MRSANARLPLLSFGAYDSAAGFFFAPGVFDPRTGETAPLPEQGIAEDVAFSFLRETSPDPALALTIPDIDRENAYSWSKAPRLGGQPAETGAVARQCVAGDPLIRALVAETGGTSVFSRVVARASSKSRG